jgi:hypothetical protein
MQIFAVPVVVVHCHCVLEAALAYGLGRVNLTERKAAAQANVRMAAMSAISWRVHNVQVMAFTPLPLVRRVGEGVRSLCDEHHNAVDFSSHPRHRRIVIGSGQAGFVKLPQRGVQQQGCGRFD